jgi:hypothetical protein
MSNFRFGMKSAILAAALLVPVVAVGQAPAAAKPQNVQLLFVQTAKSATLHKDGDWC